MIDRDESEPAPPGGKPRRSKHRRWQIAAIIAAVPVLAFGAIYIVACWRAQRLLDREIDRIAARGEPIWFADLAPAADDPSLARGRAIAAILEIISEVPFPPEPDGGGTTPTDKLEEIRKAVEANRPRCRELASLARVGECRFEHDFKTVVPAATPLPEADNLNNVDRSLSFDAEEAIQLADNRRALEIIEDILDIAEVLRSEPFYVSQLVCIRVAGSGLDNLQTLLGRTTLNEADLKQIDSRLKTMESGYRLAPATYAERASILTMLDNLGRPEMGELLESLEYLSDDSKVVPDAYWKNRWWGSWLYRPRRLCGEAVMLQTMSRFAELIDQPGPTAAAQLAAADAHFRVQARELPTCAIFLTDLNDIRTSGLAYRQRLIAARLAIAVCRYRAEHGELPRALAEVHIPRDIDLTGLISGGQLAYEHRAASFAIFDETPEQGGFAVTFETAQADR